MRPFIIIQWSKKGQSQWTLWIYYQLKIISLTVTLGTVSSFFAQETFDTKS